ncbi:D-2-hydroxyacid dehydrogenase [Roseimicrobium sp. ORNL1]|uniref:D-2-hydroxyacid dehydrogenase n=1 Tax=Roseimicrobium sp. ORNL1 TaxID=2711231 RepID=UPI0013E1C28A|nr:D-2-hydroxyacid dehydrogenase [Roseimicrobium sp. ORNL1]QIF02374.1 D-2-hydroxyacid dehydrogenase [Roseimicrobium sp. ORNL1]
MRLTILDAFTANPGDLSWAGLESLADCTFHDRTAPAEVLVRAQDAELVITNKTVLSGDTIRSLPKLKYIGVLATGYNVVDVAAAKECGITVTNVPGYSTPSVAQTVFALLLELTHRVGHHAQTVREGRWSQCPDFCYWDGTLVELSGRTLGILGYGTIGEGVARIALALGMKVIANRRTWKEAPIEGVTPASQEEVFAQSDVLSLHCPLTEDTKHIINAQNIAKMKPSALLINTARGPLVNEAELAAALNDGRLAGVGLDVLSAEPPPADNPLLTAKNCYITPHIAWASKEARERLINVATQNVKAFLDGKPQNVVG